tara:strand:- start:45155 stop:45451 length:297 start_codon:yes stop_codon:yes gene_type:complete
MINKFGGHWLIHTADWVCQYNLTDDEYPDPLTATHYSVLDPVSYSPGHFTGRSVYRAICSPGDVFNRGAHRVSDKAGHMAACGGRLSVLPADAVCRLR